MLYLKKRGRARLEEDQKGKVRQRKNKDRVIQQRHKLEIKEGQKQQGKGMNR